MPTVRDYGQQWLNYRFFLKLAKNTGFMQFSASKLIMICFLIMVASKLHVLYTNMGQCLARQKQSKIKLD